MKINGNMSGGYAALLPLGDAVFIKVILLARMKKGVRLEILLLSVLKALLKNKSFSFCLRFFVCFQQICNRFCNDPFENVVRVSVFGNYSSEQKYYSS
jgi:hypothetical protein